MTGLTAYFGLFAVGRVQPGDVVVVSGAAGATGSVAAQLAKLAGARIVIGLAGVSTCLSNSQGEQKCAWLRSLGIEPIDYKKEDVRGRLKALAPSVDVFYDNTGGPILTAVLSHLSLGARIVLCGGISGYGKKESPGPANYLNLVTKRATMQGFLITDYAAQIPVARQRLRSWVAGGQLRYQVDLQERLFTGENSGKLLIRLAEPVASAAL